MWSNVWASASARHGHNIRPVSISDDQSSDLSSNSTKNQLNEIYNRLNLPATGKDAVSKKEFGSPLMRYKHASCASHQGFIYIHGGRSGLQALDDDLWRFDAHESTWTQLETNGTKPPSLQEHSLVEWRRALYLFGGQLSASQQEDNFWCLSLDKLEWRSMNKRSDRKWGAHLGPTNRRSHSAVIYKDCMYVYGGFEEIRGSSGQLWQFDLINERWELRAPNLRASISPTATSEPEARHAHSAIVYQDSMYIYGGLSNLKPLGDLWRWSWRERRWFKERTKGPSPGQLHGHSAVEAFGSMFVFGGERRGKPTRSLWRLDLRSLSWQKIRAKGPRPAPTCWHVALANPLGLLDEANYIIETGDGAAAALESLSDNCFDFNRPTMVPKAPQVSNSVVSPLPISSSNCSRQQQFKRKLRRRLSFLSRRNIGKQRAASGSASCNEISGAAQICSKLEIAEQSLQVSASASDKLNLGEAEPAAASDEEPRNGILDTLDTDIKQMFEQSDIASQHKINDHGMSSSRLDELASCSVLGGQHSSRLSSSYQTAREQLDSSAATLKSERRAHGSSNTLVSGMATSSAASLAAHTRLLSRRRRNSAASARPRSEIVQSLIERADARIKHLYTPFFHAPSVARAPDPSYSSIANDPLLGRLQRHKMFEKPSQSNDKSKRHTIHQTMTYYNLFFSEQFDADLRSPDELDGSQLQPANGQRVSNDETISQSSSARATSGPVSTSANLIGVRGDESSTPACSHQQALQASNGDNLSLGTQQSSESNTICNRQTDDGEFRQQHRWSREKSLERADNQQGNQSEDNTSLSFSIIAEFEEDDMLQYSSPTDIQQVARMRSPKLRLSSQSSPISSLGSSPERMQVDTKEQASCPQEAEERQHDVEIRADERVSMLQSDTNHPQPPQRQNTSSSGYDSNSHLSSSLLAATTKARQASQFGTSLNEDQRCSVDRSKRMQTTASSTTADSLALTAATSEPLSQKSSNPESTVGSPLAAIRIIPDQVNQLQAPSRSLPSSPTGRDAECRRTTNCKFNFNQAAQLSSFVSRSSRKLFGGKRKSKTRYWQLCMFVMGGKPHGTGLNHGLNEPISIWRLYI